MAILIREYERLQAQKEVLEIRQEIAQLGKRISHKIGFSIFGELYLDAKGEAHFICHDKGDDFLATKEALLKFIALLQEKVNSEKNCPFYVDHD